MPHVIACLACFLVQAAPAPPNRDSSSHVEVQSSDHRLDVVNNSWRFVEFRIRASGRDRQWTKLRLRHGEADSVPLSPDGDYDVQIWSYLGPYGWFVDCQNRIPFGSWIMDEGYRGLRGQHFTRWLAKPIRGEEGVKHEYEEVSETTLFLACDENAILTIEEFRLFKLIGR